MLFFAAGGIETETVIGRDETGGEVAGHAAETESEVVTATGHVLIGHAHTGPGLRRDVATANVIG